MDLATATAPNHSRSTSFRCRFALLAPYLCGTEWYRTPVLHPMIGPMNSRLPKTRRMLCLPACFDTDAWHAGGAYHFDKLEGVDICMSVLFDPPLMHSYTDCCMRPCLYTLRKVSCNDCNHIGGGRTIYRVLPFPRNCAGSCEGGRTLFQKYILHTAKSYFSFLYIFFIHISYFFHTKIIVRKHTKCILFLYWATFGPGGPVQGTGFRKS